MINSGKKDSHCGANKNQRDSEVEINNNGRKAGKIGRQLRPGRSPEEWYLRVAKIR